MTATLQQPPYQRTQGLVGKSEGPYMGIQFDRKRTFRIASGDRTFRILTYQAYNAMGLIGSECNGILILDEDKLRVVCDELAQDTSGYFGVSRKAWDLAWRMATDMPWEEFRTIVMESGRARYSLDEDAKPKRKASLRASEFIRLARKQYEPYDDAHKTLFHQQAKVILRRLATALSLTKAGYDLRSNLAGPAVLGEVTLHTDRLYIQLSETSLGPDRGFMWRTCQGRKDYTGGANQWAKWEELEDLATLAAKMLAVSHA